MLNKRIFSIYCIVIFLTWIYWVNLIFCHLLLFNIISNWASLHLLLAVNLLEYGLHLLLSRSDRELIQRFFYQWVLLHNTEIFSIEIWIFFFVEFEIVSVGVSRCFYIISEWTSFFPCQLYLCLYVLPILQTHLKIPWKCVFI